MNGGVTEERMPSAKPRTRRPQIRTGSATEAMEDITVPTQKSAALAMMVGCVQALRRSL